MAVDPDHLPSVGELSLLIVAAREVDRAAGFLAAEHATGIRAVRRDDVAAVETDIGEKAFVALDKCAADQARAKAHADVIAEDIIES